MNSRLASLITLILLTGFSCHDSSSSGITGPVPDSDSPPGDDLGLSTESIVGVLALRDEHTGATRVLGLTAVVRDPRSGASFPLVLGR